MMGHVDRLRIDKTMIMLLEIVVYNSDDKFGLTNFF